MIWTDRAKNDLFCDTSPLCSKQYAYLFNKPSYTTHAAIYKSDWFRSISRLSL